MIAVTIALLKLCLHDGDAVFNSRAPNLVVIVVRIIIGLIEFGVGVVERLSGIDLPGGRFIGLRGGGVTHVMRGVIGVDSIKIASR